MILDQRVVVVLPAYNASKTLHRTVSEIPSDIVDEVILVDDASSDNTAEVARSLGIRHVISHPENRGYCGNQKTCYAAALELDAAVVIMLHPDYQYTPTHHRHGQPDCQRCLPAVFTRWFWHRGFWVRAPSRGACQGTSTWPTGC